MTESGYNPNDPAFLLSRGLDGDLTAEEQSSLDAAIAGSESLRAEDEGFRAVDGVVRGWASRPVEIDWESHAALIVARVRREETDDERAGLNSLLDRWGRAQVVFDERSFTSGVQARLRGRAGLRPRHARILRLGVPLAAAAAVAMTLTARVWRPAPPEPVCVVRFAAAVTTTPSGAAGSATAVVAFDRTRVERLSDSGGGGISLGFLGAESPGYVEGPPI